MTYKMSELYEIFLYNHAHEKVALLQGWDRLEFHQRTSAPWNHTLYFSFGSDDTDQLATLRTITKDYQIIVYRKSPHTLVKTKVYEGVNLTVIDQELVKGSVKITLYGKGYLDLLDRRIIIPPGGDDDVIWNNVAETVLKGLVGSCLVVPVDADRKIDELSLTIDAGAGEIVGRTLRYDNLLTVCQELASEGAVRFGIEGSDPPTNLSFKVQPVWGLDRRINSSAGNPKMFFNKDLGNLEIPLLTKNYSDEINVVYAGGEGAGSERIMLELENTTATAVSPWARSESFTDIRQTSDLAEIEDTARAYLNENKAIKTLTFNILDVPGARWIEDWNLGDIVTAKYNNYYTAKEITEVSVSVTAGESAQQIEIINIEMTDLDAETDSYLATWTIAYPTVDPFNPEIPDYPPVPNAGIKVMAVFDLNNTLFTTEDFTASPVVWSKTPLSMSGTLLQIVVDAYSPGYVDTGDTVNAWLFTSNAIYYLDDIFGTPIVTLQHTFAASTTARSADASIAVRNFVAVASKYTSPGRTRVAVTTDGANWIERDVSTGDSGSQRLPGIYVSQRVSGKILTSSTDGSGGYCYIYVSPDYGITWDITDGSNGPDSGGIGLAQELHVPYHDNDDESLVYFGQQDWFDTSYGLQRSSDPLGTLISVRHPQQSRWSITSSPLNRQNMVLSLVPSAEDNGPKLYTTTNAGSTLTECTINISPGGITPYYRCVLSGDNAITVYLMGETGSSAGEGVVAYSEDLCTSITDKTGNLASLGAYRIIGIVGGVL